MSIFTKTYPRIAELNKKAAEMKHELEIYAAYLRDAIAYGARDEIAAEAGTYDYFDDDPDAAYGEASDVISKYGSDYDDDFQHLSNVNDIIKMMDIVRGDEVI